MTAEGYVAYCSKAADEAYQAVIQSPPTKPRGPVGRLLFELGEDDTEAAEDAIDGAELEEAAYEAARAAFVSCMPTVTNKPKTLAYIACVAVGVQRRLISAQQARSMLYVCQLALSATRNRRS